MFQQVGLTLGGTQILRDVSITIGPARWPAAAKYGQRHYDGRPVTGPRQDIASAFYTCTSDWAKAHKDAITGFCASLDDAAKFIADHPDQAKQILAKFTKLPVQPIEQMPMPNFTFPRNGGANPILVGHFQEAGADRFTT